MAFAEITKVQTYKGNKIETVENPVQIVFVVNSDKAHALWSIADAKRYINGQPLKYYPVDVTSWFK